MKQILTTFSRFIRISFLIILTSCANTSPTIFIGDLSRKGNLLIHETFNKNMDNWIVEQGKGGTVKLINGKMDIDDANGCTIWFKNKLDGNIMIEYDAVVIESDGANDRVSDLNCFWMANDPKSVDFFANSANRNGKFQNYHNLQLYYVGLGGHNNTKTRFRRYAGGGERPCLPEHDLDDVKYLITANQVNAIRIIVYNDHVQYYRNGELIYDFKDRSPYSSGFFGIRTYKNHMTIDNFKVYQLK
ncbi:DUF6250 domain-containing protein [Carboxylicivirga sp. N1Y90]|uniref:DUF6250 domain-containing protein n=1 Tax=Carboxylicivirga fragile TaxID=3417571 RepID=UPI003D3410D8|nr:hypothetical protein [Marinilabiliaceae bacterium N1Y90]